MRIKNKEIRQRRHRKEQAQKEAKKNKSFLAVNTPIVAANPVHHEEVGAETPKKSPKKATPKAETTAKKAPAKPKKVAPEAPTSE